METGNITSKRADGSQHRIGRGDTTKGIHSKMEYALSEASASLILFRRIRMNRFASHICLFFSLLITWIIQAPVTSWAQDIVAPKSADD
jgi:hypothetical protein